MTRREQTIELVLDLTEWFDSPRWPQLHRELRVAFDGLLDKEDPVIRNTLEPLTSTDDDAPARELEALTLSVASRVWTADEGLLVLLTLDDLADRVVPHELLVRPAVLEHLNVLRHPIADDLEA
jgi:hypothetical protein